MHSDAGMSRGGDQRNVKLLELVALAGLAAGVFVTCPLWTGQQSFPQIPWLSALAGVSTTVDPWLLGMAGVAAIGCAVSGVDGPHARFGRWSRAAFSVAVVCVVLLNQHRLQAWVVHLLGVLGLLWFAPNRRGLSLVRLFAISVYVHSAISRCDRTSLDLQWNLVAPLLERWNIDTQFVSERARLSWAGTFAGGEFLVALLLSVPRLRGWGRWASIAMHGTLLLLLGPPGLDHHQGVLVWNVTWIAQNWVLFGPTVDGVSEGANEVRHGLRIRGWMAAGIAGVLVVAPLLAAWGWWDNWPSWRLYSGRPAAVSVTIDDSRVDDLPDAVRQYVGAPELLSEWRPVNLDAWSFSELQCPVYPQERFRIAVALALAREHQLGDDVRVVVGSPPDRWTGERKIRELRGEAALAAECGDYLVNTTARDNGPKRIR